MVMLDEEVDRKPTRRPWGLLLAAVAVTALIVAAVTYFVVQEDDDTTATKPDGPTTNVLPTGEAHIDLRTATGNVAGFPRRFPQTETGAVEAYLGWVLAPGEALQQPDAVLTQYYRDVMPADEAEREAAEIFGNRDAFGLDENGAFVGPQGSRPYSDCFPEYGAYRVDKKSETRVNVEAWMPCVAGVGSPSDTSDVYVLWSQTSGDMVWSNGDWRMSLKDADYVEAPTPQNKEKVNVSFAERAQILGDDWQMFDGASQVWPVELLGEEPR